MAQLFNVFLCVFRQSHLPLIRECARNEVTCNSLATSLQLKFDDSSGSRWMNRHGNNVIWVFH